MEKKGKGSNLLAIVSCLVVMFSVGIVYLWSVFQQPVINHFGWSSGSVAMISSVMIFMFLFGTMIGGFMLGKKSPRFVVMCGGALFFVGLFTTSLLGSQSPWLIYITYGVVAGFGVGFAYASSLNCIMRWFPDRRGFASGLAVCAFGLSAVVIAPLATWLLSLPSFGDNAVPLTFRTLAVIFSVLIVAAGVFVRNPEEEYTQGSSVPTSQTNQRQYLPREVVKTAPFWCLVAIVFFLPAIFFILNPHVKTLGVFRELSGFQASLTISLTGIFQAISRLACGIVSDKIGRTKTLLIIGVLSLIAAICIIFATGWFYSIIVWLIFFVYAGPSSIYPAMATDVYGIKHSGANYGMALMFLGLSSPAFQMTTIQISANAPETGDYTKSFILAACTCVIALIAIPLFDVFKKRLQKKESESAPQSEAAQ